MTILVAGGAGYIGSHTIVELLNANHKVVCVDNLFNSSIEAIKRVSQITNKSYCIKKKIYCVNETNSKCSTCENNNLIFYEADLLDKDFLFNIFDREKIDSVIMFAGYKAVGESVQKPLEYYYNNLISLMNLLEAMRKHNCFNIIFSSSATVYGKPEFIPITEEASRGEITSPYGKTKGMIEDILIDMYESDKKWNIVLLRYFNPVGAHKTGLIGEDPKGIPNNLMPYIAQVAIGKREKVLVYGNDYNTKDGTGVRDYIHVVDLAIAHVKALNCFNEEAKIKIYNIGTGKGYSVLDVIKAYEKAANKKINYEIVDRRKGDVDILLCDPSKAKKELDFEAIYTIDDMCKDSFNFQNKNPNGYNKEESKIKMVFE
ncbi:MAG: UDP-glucose 4-epimerase GalE [Eubacteriales bacterium]|nr:UDP-glucose 4-epimerase GalE [Eubacteriales bacterium]